MKLADTLAFPPEPRMGAEARMHWEGEFLEDTSLRRMVVEQYDREQVALRRYLLFLGLGGDSAEEVVQESFLRLHQHLLGGGERTNLRAWLYRVSHNLARNEQAAHRVRKVRPLTAMTPGDEPRTAAATPEEELLAAERLTRLQDALLGLSEAQRQCLVLRTQGFKYREIAEVLSLSVSTVGEHIQRGLERLKDQL